MPVAHKRYIHIYKLSVNLAEDKLIVFSTNWSLFKKIEDVSSKKLSSLCQLVIKKHIYKLSVNFVEDKAKSILISKVKCLNEVNTSFSGYPIKQLSTGELPV